MSLGEIGWLVALVGLPWSPFGWKAVDLWHAQTGWMHMSLALLFCWQLATGTRQAIPNPPLAWWFAWVSVSMLWLWGGSAATAQQYPMTLLMPWGHALSLVIFYACATSLWTPTFLATLFRALASGGLVLLAYGYVQAMNMDQFFTAKDPVGDIIVGTIGNPTHFSIYLTLLLPCFLAQESRHWWWAVAATIGLQGLILVSRDSVTGPACTYLLLTTYALFRKRLLGVLLLVLGLGAACWVWHVPQLMNPMGRLAAWNVFYDIISTKKSITGLGLGFVYELSKHVTTGPIAGWRHVHNEWLQLWIEVGFVGTALALWGVLHALWTARYSRHTKMGVACLSGLVAFLFSTLTDFSGHLWMLASMGLLYLCSLYVLAEPTPC